MARLILNLFSVGLKKTAPVALIGSAAVWTTASLLAALFARKLPQLWAILGDKRFNQIVFWNFTIAVDILFDVTIIRVPFIYLWRLQAPLRLKSTVWGCFAARFLYVEENYSPVKERRT
jgi:hypothetical protein